MKMENTTEQKWSLRPATLDDLEKMVQIETQVHVAPWTLEHFRSELEKPYSQVLVLTDDETDTEIAAYIVIWFMFDECQILNIVVDTPHRGLGFGKMMIRKAVSLAGNRGIQKLSLEVRKSNLPAIQLYQAVGFVILHVRKSFYSNGEDAYLMSLSLSAETIRF